MSRLVDLKRAIAGALEKLPEIAETQGFGKIFEADDLVQVSFRSPCAFIAVLAAPLSEAMNEGDSRTRIDCVAAIAAKGKAGLTPDEETLTAAEAVFKAARWAKWGLDRIWPAQNRRMEFLPVPNRKGAALLAVRWDHFIILDDADADDLIDAPMPQGVEPVLRRL